jgi:hypothetical protein
MKEGRVPKTAEDRKKMLKRVKQDARDDLIRALYAGRWWAIGYRTPTEGAKDIACVPRHHFLIDRKKEHAERRSIDWAKGELAIGSDSYFRIYVVRAPGETEQQGEEPRGAEGRAVTHQGRKGRRETKSKILEALMELWPDPVFQAFDNRTEQARALRAHVLGEAARGADYRQGYMTSGLIRLIGEYAAMQETEKN